MNGSIMETDLDFFRFDLLVTAARFVVGVLQRTDFGSGVPLQLHRLNLRQENGIILFILPILFVVVALCTPGNHLEGNGID